MTRGPLSDVIFCDITLILGPQLKENSLNENSGFKVLQQPFIRNINEGDFRTIFLNRLIFFHIKINLKEKSRLFNGIKGHL